MTFGNLTITGPDEGITIQGNDREGIFGIGDTYKTVVISNLIITGGKNEPSIEVKSSTTLLTLNNCTIAHNADSAGVSGGYLKINNCTIADNDGGGINNDGVLMLTNSTVSGNRGGAINSGDGSGGDTATIINSTISGNTASSGGAINGNSAAISIINSTIYSNM